MSPPLCSLTNSGVTIVTPRPSEFSASDVKLALRTLNIEQVKHAIVEDCWYPTSLEKNTSGHLKVKLLFYWFIHTLIEVSGKWC